MARKNRKANNKPMPLNAYKVETSSSLKTFKKNNLENGRDNVVIFVEG
jgi:hypothetical protein